MPLADDQMPVSDKVAARNVTTDTPPLDAEKLVAGAVPWSSWFIVATELCERFAFYGASLVFVPYLIRELEMDKAQATAINRGFLFFAYFTAVVGAVIADVKLGKFRTILIFSFIYMIGMILLAASATSASIMAGFGLPGFIVATYVFMACGTGGIKANVSSFVADQVVPGYTATKTPGVYADSKLTLEGVFRYFYWAINVGALLGMAISPAASRNINADQPGKGYAVAYGIPGAAFAIGIVVFILGRKRYLIKAPDSSVLRKVWGCFRVAFQRRHIPADHWLDRARGPGHLWDDQFVDDLVRTLRGCVVFLFYPVYWALYGNMSDCFIAQGMTMERPAWLAEEQLNLINALVLVVAIPVFDGVVFPFLRRHGMRLGPITRITIGFVIVSIGFIYVTVLQHIVYTTGPYYNFTNLPDDVKEPINNISIWWQIPAYVGIGVSEIFASATGLEFAYKRASPELKSIVMSLFLLTNCGGSLIGMLLSIWSTDPYFVTVFGVQAAAMGLLSGVFFYLFRSLDAED